MNQNNLVSILIPVYNRDKFIEETINSALSQTYQNIEIIIVDNNSTDNTWRIIKKYTKKDNRIKAFKNDTNIGPVRNWKKCTDKADGEFGKILWSDDLIAPEFIEKTLPYLMNSQDVGFVYTGTEVFGEKTKKSNLFFLGNSGIYKSKRYVNGVLFDKGYPVSPGCALFRLKDLKENLLINIENKVKSNFSMHAIGNDLLIFLLTAKDYKNFAFINEKLSFFRAHEDSITVRSNSGKLPLHYNLASTYFIENYQPQLIKKMNVNLWLSIKKYPKAKKYNLEKIENYYMKNIDFRMDYSYLFKKIYYKSLNIIRISKIKKI